MLRVLIEKIKDASLKIYFFFPVNLLLTHFKSNLLVLLYWLFLFAVINGYFGVKFGIQYLFLYPEYLGEISATSFLTLGFSLGGFIMAFHTYSYIRIGNLYPFIATLSRPFFKFFINNGVIPFVFIVNHSYLIWKGLGEISDLTFYDKLIFVSFYGLGILLFIVIAFLYFFPTNKDFLAISKIYGEKVRNESNIKSSFHKPSKWYNESHSYNQYYTYFSNLFSLKKSRGYKHYDLSILRKVFAQNYTNASIFEITLILSFVIIGLFRDIQVFQVPAAVSILMLLTIIIMIISSLYSWFSRWTYVFIVVVFLGLNYLSKHTDYIDYQSAAYGLNYQNKINYTPEIIHDASIDQTIIERDYQSYLNTLNNWKSSTGKQKPKLVIVNSSGGGLRSAYWTFCVLQHLNHVSNGTVNNSVQMITGASGGMIGAAFYRDLLIQHQEDLNSIQLNDSVYREMMGKDLLNRLTFSITTMDLFFRFQKEEINGLVYNIDRGYIFEQNLIDNLGGALSNKLGFYKKLEKNAKVPTMIFSPTIINDGRRLLIGAQGLSFLNKPQISTANFGIDNTFENVDYQNFFKSISPDEISFTSVLRMSATFPYIMPIVSLPTKPSMLIMDAGIRDNYGTKTTIQFLKTFESWIAQNTDGVIILSIRDKRKILKNEVYDEKGLLHRFSLPLSNLYGNFPRVQDFDQDELLFTLKRGLDFNLEVISFNLREQVNDQFSLSWHLTDSEKKRIYNTLQTPSNRAAANRLKMLIADD